jgi:hypothetical protein
VINLYQINKHYGIIGKVGNEYDDWYNNIKQIIHNQWIFYFFLLIILTSILI